MGALTVHLHHSPLHPEILGTQIIPNNKEDVKWTRSSPAPAVTDLRFFPLLLPACDFCEVSQLKKKTIGTGVTVWRYGFLNYGFFEFMRIFQYTWENVRWYMHICMYIYVYTHVFIYIPGTQMTLILVRKGLVLRSWPSKIKVQFYQYFWIWLKPPTRGFSISNPMIVRPYIWEFIFTTSNAYNLYRSWGLCWLYVLFTYSGC